MNKSTISIIIFLLPSIIAITPISTANPRDVLYKWTDGEGKNHVSDSISKTAIKRGYSIIDKKGRVLERVAGKKSKYEIEAASKRRANVIEATRNREAQKRRDSQLMSLYSSEEDIINRRDKQLKTIIQSVAIQQKNIESNRIVLSKYQEQIIRHKNKGESVPLQLTNNVSSITEEIESRNKIITQKQEEYDRINKKFNSDLTRYRQIKNR